MGDIPGAYITEDGYCYCTNPSRTIQEWKWKAKHVWCTHYDFVTPLKPKRKSKGKLKCGYFQLYTPMDLNQKGDTNTKTNIKKEVKKPNQNTPQKLHKKRNAKVLPEKIKVFVKTPLSTVVNLSFNPNASVAAVKKVIGDKLGIGIEKQDLFIGSIKMFDFFTLYDYGVKDQSNLELKLCRGLLGGADKPQDQDTNSAKDSIGSSLPEASSTAQGTSQKSTSIHHPEIVNITGDNNIVVSAAENASVTIIGNTNEVHEMKLRIDILEEEKQQMRQDIQRQNEEGQRMRQEFQRQMNELFQIIKSQGRLLAARFEEHEIGRVDKLQMGSVLIIICFSKRKQLENIWKKYQDGSLLKLLQTTWFGEDGQQKVHAISNLKVTIDQEEYLKGMEIFQKHENQITRPLAELNTEELKDFLIKEGIPTGLAQTIFLEEIDGMAFAEYTEQELEADLNLKKGPLRKLLRIRDRYSKSSISEVKMEGEKDKRLSSTQTALGKQDLKDVSCPSDLPSQDSQTRHSASAEPQTENIKDVSKHLQRGSIKEIEKRLRNLLLGDEKYTLDESYYPVLVANEPQHNLLSSEAYTVECLSFISEVDWRVVFDFYAGSNVDGLCRYFSETRKSNLQLPETVDSTNLSFLERVEDPLWIFCNGRIDDVNIIQPVLSRPKWNEERSKDVEDVIGYIAKQSIIPSSRSVIVFLVLSQKDIGILSDTFRKCISAFHGMDNITCIVDNTDLYNLWEEELHRWCDLEELKSRSVVGVPLTDINKIMNRMSKVHLTEDKMLPLGAHRGVYVSERDVQKWKDITVVCQNECKNTDMDEDHPEFEAFLKEKELQFYKGHKPTWWNFAFTDSPYNNNKGYNHVLRRSSYDKLASKINSALHGSLSRDLIITITMFHQPGCGASTLARHQLWGFHTEYRCLVVDRVTANTAKQILDVRTYKCPDKQICLPVLVLADDLEDTELTDLISDLETLSKDLIVNGVLCVILHCKRTPNPNELLKRCDEHLGFTLQQELDERERRWFQKKYKELESKEDLSKSGDYKPERLIAFMVMKEECNPKYVSKVVSEVLVNVHKHSAKEYTLLKYAAVLNSHLGDAVIPVSCCDEYMSNVRTYTKRSTRVKKSTPWEKTLSLSSQMVLIKVQVSGIGHIHGIKIVHRCVAEEIVRQITDEKDQSLADIVLEFIQSDLLQSVSRSKEHLKDEISDLVRRRKKYELGDNEETLFSPLIECVYNKDKQKALEILELGHEVFSDPYYAQQAARLCYILDKDYTKAHQYAQKAIDQRSGHAFFWDTKGHIYENEIKAKYKLKYQEHQSILPMENSTDLLKLSVSAIQAFKKAQELRPSRSITSAFSAEVNLSFMLIQIIDYCIPVFRASGGRQRLKEYLINDSIPDELGDWKPYHKFLKGLRANIDIAMQEIDNFLIFSKDASPQNLMSHEVDMKRLNQQRFHKLYVEYFGESLQTVAPSNPADLPDWRRRQVTALGADNFHRIFELAKNRSNESNREKLKTIIGLLSENRPFSYFDLRNLICAILALHSFGGKDAQQLPSFDEVYEMVRELKDKGLGNELFGPFFLLMFLWPHPRADTHRIKHPQKLSNYVNDLKTRWEKQWDYRRDTEDEKHDSLGTMKRRHKSTRRRPVTYFFLAEGKGLMQFAHINEFNATQNSMNRERFWVKDVIRNRLTRLRGTLYNNVLLSYVAPTGEQLYIRLAVPKAEVESQEPVTFYLGFSWGGPYAHDVKTVDNQTSDRQRSYKNAYPRYLMTYRRQTDEDIRFEISQLETKKDELERRLGKLEKLDRKKKNGQSLTSEQTRRLKQKPDVLKQIKTVEDAIKEKTDALDMDSEDIFD